jgi:uncharacterized membrane protein
VSPRRFAPTVPALAGALLLLLAAAPAARAFTYRVTPLASSRWLYPFAVAINNAGEVCGQAAIKGDLAGYVAFTGRGGAAIRVLPSAGGSMCFSPAYPCQDRALDINAAGFSAGSSGQETAVVWAPDGTPRALTTTDGLTSYDWAEARGINDRGQVAGFVYGFSGIGHRAARWEPDGSLRVVGAPPGFAWAVATAIDEAGRVAGYAWGGPGSGYQAFLWDASPGFTLFGGDCFANALGDGGRVVGSCGGTNPWAFAWDPAQGVQRLASPPGGAGGEAIAVNRWGDVVGTDLRPDGLPAGALWRKAQEPALLDTLVDPRSAGWKVGYPSGINDAGQIVARAESPDGGFSGAVVLSPVVATLVWPPEAGSAATAPSVRGGTVRTIRWTSFATPADRARIRIAFSRDGGATWTTLAALPAAGSHAWSWRVPTPRRELPDCRIRLTVRHPATGRVYGTVDSKPFRILPAAR